MLVALLLPKVLGRLPERPVMNYHGAQPLFVLAAPIVCSTCLAMVATGCRRIDGHAPYRALAQAFVPVGRSSRAICCSTLVVRLLLVDHLSIGRVVRAKYGNIWNVRDARNCGFNGDVACCVCLAS